MACACGACLREMLLGQHREAQDQEVAFEPAAPPKIARNCRRGRGAHLTVEEMVALLNPALAAAA